ncbi:MFS transporter [Granulicoccus phenolivorans]|uniref:MFS transporter n=1 Tax=Granulicoccus phenolivorans TaxID=266854 RepID=UPI00138AB7DB|nr:MFS transporter [Granulicoccus phenolivorans]
MTPSPAATPKPSGRRRRIAFLASASALVAAFAASSSPVPLYNSYRATAGLTNADLSLTVVAYFLGTLAALLCLGRLSDYVGRRPVGLATMLILIAGCAVLLNVTSVVPLVVGRMLMGVAAGLASSALTAYAVDTAPPHPAWLGSMVSSQSPLLGLTVGSLLSGALYEFAPAPTQTIYVVMMIALALCAGLLLAGAETRPRRPGALASLRPRIRLTERAKPLMPIVSVVAAATWALGSYYQGFGPSVTATYLGTSNALVVALVFASYMAPSVVAGPLSGRMRPARAQRLGMVLFAVGTCGLLVSLWQQQVVAFLLFGLVAGLGQGVAASAGIRGILYGSLAQDRSSLLSAVYLVSYASAMLATLIAGQVSRVASLLQLTVGYAVLAVVAMTVTLIWARDPAPLTGSGNPSREVEA